MADKPVLNVITLDRKVNKDVSEAMLSHANNLRLMANQIESGEITGIAYAMVYREESGKLTYDTRYCADEGCTLLLGATHLMANQLTVAVNEKDESQ